MDPEMADENIERELRSRRYQNATRVVVRMVHVERVADAHIEPEGVELGDRPEGVDVHLRAQNNVILRPGSDENRPRRAEEDRGSVFSQVNVVIVLDTHGRAKAELDRTDLEIVGNLVDRLAGGFRRFLPRG